MCTINKSAHMKKSLETYRMHLVCPSVKVEWKKNPRSDIINWPGKYWAEVAVNSYRKRGLFPWVANKFSKKIYAVKKKKKRKKERKNMNDQNMMSFPGVCFFVFVFFFRKRSLAYSQRLIHRCFLIWDKWRCTRDAQQKCYRTHQAIDVHTFEHAQLARRLTYFFFPSENAQSSIRIIRRHDLRALLGNMNSG